MKQKKLGDILYVFTDEPYEITEDTDASIVYVQAHSKEGFEALNPDLTFKKINYNVFTVKEPEWKEYLVTPDDNNSQAEPVIPDPTPVEYDKYTITFMDGADSIYSITDVTGTAIDVPLNPTKEGYTFDGWSTEEGEGAAVITPESYIGTENITYFAVWTEVQNQDPEPVIPDPNQPVLTECNFISYNTTLNEERQNGKFTYYTNTSVNGLVQITITEASENNSEDMIWLVEQQGYYISDTFVADDNEIYPIYMNNDGTSSPTEIGIKVISIAQ